MALFVIADLHLSLGTDKPMDVFQGWQDHVQRLEANWHATVSPDDTVVIAGDISWAMKLEDCQKDFAFIHSLPGKKLLMKGNHDYWWSTRNKIDNFLAANGFDTIQVLHNCGYRIGERAVCGTRGWLYNSETDEDKKIVAREAGRLLASMNEAKALGGLDSLADNHVADCYFGHIHGSCAAKKALVGEYRGVKMHLISCDHIGFCPERVE